MLCASTRRRGSMRPGSRRRRGRPCDAVRSEGCVPAGFFADIHQTMKLSKIQELLRLVAESGVSEIEIEEDDYKLTIRQNSPQVLMQPAGYPAQQGYGPPQHMQPQAPPQQAPPQQPAPPPQAPQQQAASA